MWAWSDGSAADFSTFPDGVAPWNPGEPNGHTWGGAEAPNSDGAYMFPRTNEWVKAGTWDDNDITTAKPFVCRRADSSLPMSRKGGGSGAVVPVLLTLLFLGLSAGGVVYYRKHGLPCKGASSSSPNLMAPGFAASDSSATPYVAPSLP